MPASVRPPLAKGLVVTGKVLASLAGVGGIVGGVACGVGLAQPTGGGSFDIGGPAIFGFFLLLASAGLGFLALTVYSLGVAADTTAASAPRVLGGVGGGLGALSFLLFFLEFSDNAPLLGPYGWTPFGPALALVLMLSALVAHAVTRRPGQR